MGWAVGYDGDRNRDIGYGVPSICDHPDCNEEIDRGLSYTCGGVPFGGEDGCGLYFCSEHLSFSENKQQRCERCTNNKEEFTPKPDTKEWIQHKLTDESWQQWRDENPIEVEKMKNNS